MMHDQLAGVGAVETQPHGIFRTTEDQLVRVSRLTNQPYHDIRVSAYVFDVM